MSFLNDYKKMKKKIEKNRNKINKAFGISKKGKEASKEKEHEYTEKQRKSKLVRVPKGAIEKVSELDRKWYDLVDFEIEDSVRVFYLDDEEITIGYLPSSITEFLENHDDGQTTLSINPEDLSVIITYID